MTSSHGRLRFPPLPAGAAQTLAVWWSALLVAIGATFEREIDRGRVFLWFPVAFGSGILIYFALPREPSAVALGLLALTLAVVTWVRRHTAASFRILFVLAAVASGTLVAKLRTDWVAAPVLVHERTATVAGWISAAEESASGGKRILIRVASIAGIPAGRTPRVARVTVRSGAADLSVGTPVSVLASLGPPSGPVMPGGYDFAFVPYYQGIGATGFAFGAAKPAMLGPAPWSIGAMEPLARLRDLLRTRIEAALPGDYGHIAAALIMGDQRGIAEKTQDDMRASGLGHILSISGLHLALVAGSVFWLIRALLALSPALALNYPIKKWAAGAALAVATFYTSISGAEVATVRSWVMLAVMLSAILLDRRALTLRNVALAALVILVFSPESLMSISFQMSFAATAALVATYEVLADRGRRALRSAAAREPTWANRAGRAIGTLLLTSLVAGLATAPFSAYYFYRLAPLTIIANVAAAPAVGFVVMPMALAAVLLMPFGLEALPLTVMQWGLQWMVAVAEKTAAWSAGLGGVAAFPPMALLLMTLGFLWLTLWRERWRLLGMVPILVALPMVMSVPRPDIIVDEDATAVAVRGDSGRLSILGGKGATFEVENWLKADADPRTPAAPDLGNVVQCDGIGCVGHMREGQVVAFARRPEALAEDCLNADVVVTRYDAPAQCADHSLVIDGRALGAFGAHAVYLSGSEMKVVGTYPAIRRPFMPPVRE